MGLGLILKKFGGGVPIRSETARYLLELKNFEVCCLVQLISGGIDVVMWVRLFGEVGLVFFWFLLFHHNTNKADQSFILWLFIEFCIFFVCCLQATAGGFTWTVSFIMQLHATSKFNSSPPQLRKHECYQSHPNPPRAFPLSFCCPLIRILIESSWSHFLISFSNLCFMINSSPKS